MILAIICILILAYFIIEHYAMWKAIDESNKRILKSVNGLIDKTKAVVISAMTSLWLWADKPDDEDIDNEIH